MLRLVYFSTAKLGLDQGSLEAIMASAVAHNRAAGVTGVLLFNGLNFLQALEGPEPVLERLYARIERDPRHAGVRIIRREAIEAVTFPDWGMKLTQVPRSESLPLRKSEEVANSLINLSGQDIQKIIDAFLSLN
ncbi:MAG: blue light sensor protein [Methylocystis sp.]|nr:MAG: blue light sensor protein [Methylocystis sp.]